MIKWKIKEHPDFFLDLDKLSIKDLQNLYNKKKKVKENPIRTKLIKGKLKNCYIEPIARRIKFIYHIKDRTIWLFFIRGN